MSVEKIFDITSPKIDIELCTTDNNMPPIDKVYAMDEDSFEKFINEWLYACYSKKYKRLQRIGGAGDKGRDIIATFADNSMDYFQCKHYDNQLSPSEFYVEFGKLCYYTCIQDIPVPKNYYIVASHDIGPKLSDLLQNPSKINLELITNWNKYCYREISKNNPIPLSPELEKYINNFDFSICQHLPIQHIINEHIKTNYGKIRFGGEKIILPKQLIPGKKINDFELPYIEALLEMYSEYAKTTYNDIKALQNNSELYSNLQDQRYYFFSAETVRRFVRDTFTNEDEFYCLEEEIYEGIKEIHNDDYENGFKRLNKDLAQATTVQTSKSLLDSKLKMIGSKEKKGVCHMLVEDKNIRWVK